MSKSPKSICAMKIIVCPQEGHVGYEKSCTHPGSPPNCVNFVGKNWSAAWYLPRDTHLMGIPFQGFSAFSATACRSEDFIFRVDHRPLPMASTSPNTSPQHVQSSHVTTSNFEPSIPSISRSLLSATRNRHTKLFLHHGHRSSIGSPIHILSGVPSLDGTSAIARSNASSLRAPLTISHPATFP